MMLYKLGSYEISDAGCYKCQHHLDRASAEQKREGTACYSGCKSKPCRGVNCRKYIEFVEEHIGYPITMVSNGPGRDDIIYRGFEK